MLYSVVWVSAVQQCEAVISIHISTLSWASLPPPIPPFQVITEHRGQLLALWCSFLLATCFTCDMKVTQLCPALCDPMDCTVHGIFQARILVWVAFPFSRGSSQPRSPTLWVDSLLAEQQGKPKSTGMGSLSLDLWIFPTRELNWDLLPCRWILYQLNYQGSPCFTRGSVYMSVLLWIRPTLSFPSHPVSTSPFSMSVLYFTGTSLRQQL